MHCCSFRDGSKTFNAGKIITREETSVKLNKDVTICFRTNTKVQEALKAEAEKELVSVSGLINTLLGDYLNLKSGSNKRRYSRKESSIPVIINGESDAGKVLLNGTIQDVSLGGVRIAIPKDEQGGTFVIQANVRNFEIVFRLPDGSTRPVSMVCKPSSVSENGSDVQVGAAFQDGDLQSYFEIQSYLM